MQEMYDDCMKQFERGVQCFKKLKIECMMHSRTLCMLSSFILCSGQPKARS
jgi:hypothetical protein